MKRMTTARYNTMTPQEQVDWSQKELSRMMRQQHGMDMADSVAPLFALALFAAAAIAYVLIH